MKSQYVVVMSAGAVPLRLPLTAYPTLLQTAFRYAMPPPRPLPESMCARERGTEPRFAFQ
jgi:hypothetical protein